MQNKLIQYIYKCKPGVLGSLGLILAYFVLNFIVVSPFGNFPVNDDWSYAVEVKQLMDTGKFELLADLAACVLHIHIGAFVCTLFGFSHIVMRITTWFLGLVGTLALYGALRELKLRQFAAILFALTYAANPLFVNLCFSFMTDVPSLCFANLYFWLCLRVIRSNNRQSDKNRFVFFIELAAASLVLVATLAIRQSFVVFLLPNIILALCFYFSKRSFLPTLIALVIVPLIYIFISEHFMQVHTLYPASYIWIKAAFLSTILNFFKMPFESMEHVFIVIGQLAFYFGLFCLPILISFIATIFSFSKSKTKMAGKASLVFYALSAAVIFFTYSQLVVHDHKLMPFNQNLLRIPMIGPLTIMGINVMPLSPRRRVYLTIFSALFAFVLLVVIFIVGQRTIVLLKKAILANNFKRTHSIQAVFCFAALFSTLAYQILQAMVRDVDRYYLMALTPLMLCLALGQRWYKARFLPALSVICLIAIGSYATIATQDFMNWNRARWQLLQNLEAKGIDYKQIDGGYEYDYYRDPSLNRFYVPVPGGIIIDHRGVPPRDNWRWWAINGEEYIVSFSPIPEYDVIMKASYWSPLSWSTKEVLALKHGK